MDGNLSVSGHLVSADMPETDLNDRFKTLVVALVFTVHCKISLFGYFSVPVNKISKRKRVTIILSNQISKNGEKSVNSSSCARARQSLN